MKDPFSIIHNEMFIFLLLNTNQKNKNRSCCLDAFWINYIHLGFWLVSPQFLLYIIQFGMVIQILNLQQIFDNHHDIFSKYEKVLLINLFRLLYFDICSKSGLYVLNKVSMSLYCVFEDHFPNQLWYGYFNAIFRRKSWSAPVHKYLKSLGKFRIHLIFFINNNAVLSWNRFVFEMDPISLQFLIFFPS